MTNNDGDLVISRQLAVQLMHAAQREPDREVCGLIAARNGEPSRYLPVPNAAADAARTFEMAAEPLVQAMASIREAGESLWAVFHSHPSAPAEPSARDLDEPAYPEAYRVIASLDTKGVLELRCWSQREGRAEERVLRVREQATTTGDAK